MKLRWFSSILIFLSAYSPLSVIFLIQDLNLQTYSLNHPDIVFCIFGVSVVSVFLTYIAVTKIRVSTPPITILSVSNQSGELINYSIPYMLSFFVMDLSNTKLLLSFGFFMFLMYVLTLKTHNIFINPILAVMGYNIYNIKYEKNGKESESFLLIKGDRLKINEKCRIIEVSEHLLLVTDRNPEV